MDPGIGDGADGLALPDEYPLSVHHLPEMTPLKVAVAPLEGIDLICFFLTQNLARLLDSGLGLDCSVPPCTKIPLGQTFEKQWGD